jgi:hypothetical protein
VVRVPQRPPLPSLIDERLVIGHELGKDRDAFGAEDAQQQVGNLAYVAVAETAGSLLARRSLSSAPLNSQERLKAQTLRVSPIRRRLSRSSWNFGGDGSLM